MFNPETAGYTVRYRHYSPKLGRFVERDPAGYTDDGMNLYEYAGSSPFVFGDPMGLSPVAHAGHAGVVVALLRKDNAYDSLVEAQAMQQHAIIQWNRAGLIGDEEAKAMIRAAGQGTLAGIWGLDAGVHIRRTTQMEGALRVASGALQVGLGRSSARTGGLPGAKGVGVGLFVHGWDEVLAGYRQLVSGEYEDTFLSGGLQLTGVCPDTARQVENYAEILAELYTGVGLLRAAVRNAGGVGNFLRQQWQNIRSIPQQLSKEWQGLRVFGTPTSGLRNVDDVLRNPSLLRGKTPDEVSAMIGNPPGWKVETLGQGTHAGEGWVLRQYHASGEATGRIIRWHPGGGRHGPGSYWRVSSPELGKSEIIR